MKTIRLCLLIFCLSYLMGCGQIDAINSSNSDRSIVNSSNNLAETATPQIIQELASQLDRYNPHVRIVSPNQEQVFSQSNIDVQLEVEDLPIFRDNKSKLGNHLNLILDNEPPKQIYNATEPVVLENLTPGTHTLRAIASRPWGESYKNEGAYAQTTFSVLTETNDNRPDRNLPLLTYNNPTGTYGAEPILLDFYLTNAPLHSVAKNDSNLSDWRIKTTVNGDSFLLENWQPVYLTGLNKGENWIQLELIDEAGNNIENTYNNTVRVINYDPQVNDFLSQLVTGKIDLASAQAFIEPNYNIQPVGTPEIIEPSLKVDETEAIDILEKTSKNTKDTTEPSVEDKLEAEISNSPKSKEIDSPIQKVIELNSEESQLGSDSSDLDARQVPTEVSTQPLVINPPAIVKIEEASEIAEDSAAEIINKPVLVAPTEAESTESQQVITITKENENSDSLESAATIEVPQAKSVEISEGEIAIATPTLETESNLNIEVETETEAEVWWKKILVRLRQTLESLVQLLPQK